MIIHSLTLGKIVPTNTYFYIDENSGTGVIIDPADDAATLNQIISSHRWKIEKILLTHGHFDHIGAVEELHNLLNIPYFIHKNGKQYLENPSYNLSAVFDYPIVLKEADYLEDGEIITLSSAPDFALKVIHTPGHTSDSCVYHDEKAQIAFVGDTIFKNSAGRTDLPGGDYFLLEDSIENKIFTLPDKTVLYSGHTEPTTVGAEKNEYKLICSDKIDITTYAKKY